MQTGGKRQPLPTIQHSLDGKRKPKRELKRIRGKQDRKTLNAKVSF